MAIIASTYPKINPELFEGDIVGFNPKAVAFWIIKRQFYVYKNKLLNANMTFILRSYKVHWFPRLTNGQAELFFTKSMLFWVSIFCLICYIALRMMKLFTFVFLLQLMKRRQFSKLQSTDSPIKLASRSRNERAKKITSPSRSLAGILAYLLLLVLLYNFKTFYVYIHYFWIEVVTVTLDVPGESKSCH